MRALRAALPTPSLAGVGLSCCRALREDVAARLVQEIVDDLSPYDKATVRLWQRSYDLLLGHVEQRSLAEAAVHAVLPGLRRCSDVASLFAAYEAGAVADLQLISSVVLAGFGEERRWTVRDAAFWLRWLELTGQGP